MADIYIVLFFSLIGGLLSLAGGLVLFSSKKMAGNLIKYVTPFAAGALLAAAFVDLLTEAGHKGNIDTALIWAMIGIVAFFILERSVRWFHHHHGNEEKVEGSKNEATIPLIIIGDTIHNFIDGIAIAAAFLIDIPTGIVTTIAVAAHEIPQEISDFGLLLHKGMRRKSVILVNALSAVATVVAAVFFFQLGQSVTLPLDILLGLVAGFFIYIAVSDIIPTLHKSKGRLAGIQTVMLIVGIVTVSLVTSALHAYIDSGDHAHESSHQHEAHHEDEHVDEKLHTE